MASMLRVPTAAGALSTASFAPRGLAVLPCRHKPPTLPRLQTVVVAAAAGEDGSDAPPRRVLVPRGARRVARTPQPDDAPAPPAGPRESEDRSRGDSGGGREEDGWARGGSSQEGSGRRFDRPDGDGDGDGERQGGGYRGRDYDRSDADNRRDYGRSDGDRGRDYGREERGDRREWRDDDRGRSRDYGRDGRDDRAWRGESREWRDDRGGSRGYDRDGGDRDREWRGERREGREERGGPRGEGRVDWRERGDRGGRFGRGRGDRRGRDRDEERGPRVLAPPREPRDPAMLASPRYLAIKQLLRVEAQGAYVGLVSGSPTPETPFAAMPEGGGRRAGPDAGSDDEDDDEEVAAPGGRQQRQEPLDPRDQRLVKELVAGVTRLQRRLDYIAAKLSNQTPSEWEPLIRLIIRLGLFELSERRLAPHAISQHVALAKAMLREGAGGFVNGVLRNGLRAMEAGGLPTPESDPTPLPEGDSRAVVRRMALQHSHPNWLVQRWLKRFGREAAEAVMRRNNLPPVYSVRVNTLRPGATAPVLLEELREAGVEAELSPLLPGEFIRVRSGLQKLLQMGYVSRGSLFVQDESAGLVVALLDPQPGDRILDCCSAPGGKTLFAAARMQGRGAITALDASEARLKALRGAAEASGVSELVTTVAADLRQWAEREAERGAWAQGAKAGAGGEGGGAAAGGQRPLARAGGGLYDKVLLDAPCTGTGVLSKRADLRWRRTPEQLEQLLGLQDQLLDSAARLVAPGGLLVYSTCSMEPEEDAERVEAFLQRHPDFEAEPAARAGLVAAAVKGQGQKGGVEGEEEGEGVVRGVPAEVVTAAGFMQTLPHVHGTDGAFAARLRRKRG
ncbi:hypothetical protein HYH03_002911 [Edaphochlamys debaryana]|uniref:SAM-dependent MTase RsmB/NOP-type domain-containing protein n=1 Tax=Edaphochlamys debaryana TaxID=47281 RepID=A0A835YAF7_9CHLO|nr:hypothetical protein HYH03_002911 [Edaphochlamys debaryana]|eukprot:KAG2499335.1 hypothetical protein HYH03_002911 [Edaphochlamys debaryana]